MLSCAARADSSAQAHRHRGGGGQGGQCPPIFVFAPPIFFSCPPRYLFRRKKLVCLGGKNVKICDFGQKTFFVWILPAFGRKICDYGQKKPSDFGEDLFFFFLAKTFPPLILILPPPRSREAGDTPGSAANSQI